MFVFCFVGFDPRRPAPDDNGQGCRSHTDRVSGESLLPDDRRLPEDYAQKIKKISGVREVMPIQVWTNICRASLDIVVFNGANPAQVQQSRPITLASGSWQQFQTQRDAAIVGQNVAKRRGLKAGDQFSIGDISVRVAGVFESTVPSEENLIYTSLAYLQYTRGLDAAGLVSQHEVF